MRTDRYRNARGRPRVPALARQRGPRQRVGRRAGRGRGVAPIESVLAAALDGVRHAGVVSHADLDQIFVSVAAARVVAGATFDERHRSHQTTLAVESSSEALASLRLALHIDADSLLEAHAFMTPGEPTLALFGKGVGQSRLHEVRPWGQASVQVSVGAFRVLPRSGFVRWRG